MYRIGDIMGKFNKLIIISLGVLLIDMLSKVLIKHFILLGIRVRIIKGFLYITYVKNTGAAFSIFRNNTIFLIILSILVIGLLFYYLNKKESISKLENISYGLILGGALGNLFDRITYGYVIDFIDIYIFKYDYPVFNIADMAIVIGVIILIIDLFRGEKDGIKGRKKVKDR